MHHVAHLGFVFDLHSRQDLETLSELKLCHHHHWRAGDDAFAFLAMVGNVYRWPTSYATNGHTMFGGTCACGSDIATELPEDSLLAISLGTVVRQQETLAEIIEAVSVQGLDVADLEELFGARENSEGIEPG